MNAGGGPTVLLGAEGDDKLVGFSGRNILIGGLGADRLVGGWNDDLLIAGRTAFDIDDEALEDGFDEVLESILAEWNSTRDYATRVANLRDGSGSTDRLNGEFFLKKGETVFDDDEVDVLTGAAGLDWFFFDPDLDELTDGQPNEEEN